ncbi:nematocyst expressed protein 3-like [Schistocerca gregaria]|uniref:nematocyst expressed protein 3-like n=1 Tax=Schistocerca gregaria TaxID=7010 RepID=UPI00211E6E11|nr:nematocyst expressed protein 3-like [Schistocerca gregaria]
MICRSSWSCAPTPWRTANYTNCRGSPTFRFRPKIFAPGEALCSAFAARGSITSRATALSRTDVLNAPAPTQEVRATVRPLRSRLVHSVAVLTWPAIVGVRCGSVPSLATWPNTSATSEETSNETARRSFAAATSGAPSAVPAASAAPAPAASDAVPIPEAPAPPPQLLVADPGTACPEPSARPRPANRLRGGQRPVGTQRSAPSVEQPKVDSPSESATPPPSSDGPRRLPPPLTWPTSSRS